jgi:hypothetical protein
MLGESHGFRGAHAAAGEGAFGALGADETRGQRTQLFDARILVGFLECGIGQTLAAGHENGGLFTVAAARF